MRKTNRGFTLMEVMVAVLVLGIALTAIIKATADNGANLGHLRQKTLAHWVAQNKYAELRITDAWTDARRAKGSSELAGREWFWMVETQTTPNDNLRRVTVRVSDQENSESWLAVLDGFLGNPSLRQPVPQAGAPGGNNNGGGNENGGSNENGNTDGDS